MPQTTPPPAHPASPAHPGGVAAPGRPGDAGRPDQPAPPRQRSRFAQRVAAHTPRWLDIPWLGGITVAPWVLLATVGIIAAAALGSAYVSHRPDRLDYGTRSFQISARQAELTFDVEKSPEAVAQCTVEALSLNSSVIGRKTDIVVGPAPDGRQVTTVTTVVPTSERATAVEVEDCWITRKG